MRTSGCTHRQVAVDTHQRGDVDFVRETDGSAVPRVRTSDAYRRRIARYYDHTQRLYARLWSPSRLHYGFWDTRTLGRQAAIRNMDHFVANHLAVRNGDRVLDAGCGVGGTSILFAEAYRLHVVGITLSSLQLRWARKLASATQAPIKPEFHLADYMDTGFPDATFDGIYAIESVCYAEPKEAFLVEAFRLLKPGGRLVVSDGFLSGPIRAHERRDYRRLLDGFALINLATIGEFTRGLERAGFTSIRCFDKSVAILPSAYIIEALSYVGLAVCALPCWTGMFPKTWFRHGLAGISQRRLFHGGPVAYCVFVASKQCVSS